MTKQEFLQQLSETPRAWGLIRRGNTEVIRRGDLWSSDYACPIVGVAGCGSVDSPQDVAYTLGLDSELIAAILGAADQMDHYDPDLRAELLAACGLGPNPHAHIRTPDQFVRDLQAEFSMPQVIHEIE